MSHRHFAIALLFFVCCYPPPHPMIFPTTKTQTAAPVQNYARALAAAGYEIKLIDEKSGIVNTEWLEYSVPLGSNFVPMPVRERVQIITDSKGAAIRYEAQCDWRKSAAGGNTASILMGQTPDTSPMAATWETCQESDAIPNNEIKGHYRAVVAAVKAAAIPPQTAARKPMESLPNGGPGQAPTLVCSRDIDCEGDRVCQNGKCIDAGQ
jgi:hypothetical protein